MTQVGLMEIEIHIPAAQSLKQKRTVIKSLRDRTTQKFNISMAEVAFHDKWQRAMLAIAIVSADRNHIENQFAQVLNFIEAEIVGSAIIIGSELTFL